MLADAILKRARDHYAIADDQGRLRACAEALAKMIAALPFQQWRRLSGPYWNIFAPKDLVVRLKSPEPSCVPYVIDDMERIVIV